eukprot:COSAG06_NODE_432_length_15846_cov_18.957325_23_plen_91_part_00
MRPARGNLDRNDGISRGSHMHVNVSAVRRGPHSRLGQQTSRSISGTVGAGAGAGAGGGGGGIEGGIEGAGRILQLTSFISFIYEAGAGQS